MKKTRPFLLITTAALLASATACTSEPEIVAGNNVEEAVETPEPETPAPQETAPPIVNDTGADANASAELPPEPATSPDEQMLDDASATGMTARATREEETSSNQVDEGIEQK